MELYLHVPVYRDTSGCGRTPSVDLNIWYITFLKVLYKTQFICDTGYLIFRNGNIVLSIVDVTDMAVLTGNADIRIP